MFSRCQNSLKARNHRPVNPQHSDIEAGVQGQIRLCTESESILSYIGDPVSKKQKPTTTTTKIYILYMCT
jgi:hypothetical protein